MTAFVSVVGRGRDIPDLPAACVAALRVPGARAPVLHATAAFSCAAAGIDGAPGLIADGAAVTCGDVRLDDRASLEASLEARSVTSPEVKSMTSPEARPATPIEASPATPSGTPRGPAVAPTGSHRGRGTNSAVGLVHAAHLAWGHEAPRLVSGDYAYAHWDGDRCVLVAARDGMGVRPLYYARAGGLLIVSNLVGALRAHPAVSSALHDDAVRSFLRRGWNADRSTTTFAHIRAVPPGCALVATPGGDVRIVPHWEMPDPAPLFLRDEHEYVERYRALLRAAVADRIVPGRTVLLLSGGIDSPTIAAAAADAGLLSGVEGVTTRVTDVETTVESGLARDVAVRLGMRHRLVESAVDPVPDAPRATPEPHDDPEFPGTRAYFGDLARGASVVIEGEDGDALFSPPGLVPMLRREPAATVLARVARYTLRHGHHPYVGFWLRRRLGIGRPPIVRCSWIRSHPGDVARDGPAPPNTARPEAAASLGSAIWQAVHNGTHRAYHGAAIDFRWPLLDARLLRFVFAIPAIPWCQRKWLPRRAYAHDLPESVIRRRKTTIPGYFERLVSVWRARTGARTPPLTAVTAGYVDRDSLSRVLASDDTEEVMAAWRAIQFDQWVRGAGLA